MMNLAALASKRAAFACNKATIPNSEFNTNVPLQNFFLASQMWIFSVKECSLYFTQTCDRLLY